LPQFKTPFDPEIIKKILTNATTDALGTMCNITFSQDPEFAVREIIEYESKMRTFGLEKFNGPCYLASINFYENKVRFKAKDASGVLVTYIEESCASDIVKGLGAGTGLGVDEDDIETILDTVGEICNVIAGEIKTEMVNQLGYATPAIISAPIKSKNDIAEGVDFAYNEQCYYEAFFFIKKTKSVALAFSVSPAGK